MSLRWSTAAALLSLGLLAAPPGAASAQSVQLSPEAQTAVNGGLAAAKRQDWNAAVTYFLYAQKADPNVPQIWYYLGLASSKIPGYEFRSIAWFKAYLQANPSAPNAAAIQSEITQLEIAYESTLSALVDPLESLARSQAANGIASTADQITLAGLLAEMRLCLGDSDGAQRTSTAFGITAPYLHSAAPSPVETTELITLGRNGYHNASLNASDFDDITLDGYLAALKQYLSGLDNALVPNRTTISVASLAELFNAYRRVRALYGSVGGMVTQYPLSTANSRPDYITVGPDRNLWFTESRGVVGKITTGGIIAEYAAPGLPEEIAVGPDGNLWITEWDGNNIGRMSPDGTYTNFPLVNSFAHPEGIVSGPEPGGTVWFTEMDGHYIAKLMAKNGAFAGQWGTAGNPLGITVGPDGNLWYTEFNGDKIGQMSPEGHLVEYSLPEKGSRPFFITTGPDGNLWFTESSGKRIGRITGDGTITEYPTPGSPRFISRGPDGAVWFSEGDTNKIGRMTMNGALTEYTAPGYPNGIVTGPDGNIWFTESQGNAVGKIVP
jgi:streptogramin lyase